MVNRWSTEEINTLVENWTIPPNITKLQRLLNRSPASIYERAHRSGLKVLSYTETYNTKHRKEIIRKKKLFLKAFKKLRVEKKARIEYGIGYQTIRKWLKEDTDFADQYQKIRNYISNTKKCVYCHKVGTRDKFRQEDERRSRWKTGICNECDSKRVIKKNSRTIRTRIHHIWKRTRTKHNLPGRTPVTISDLAEKDLINLYEKQEGKCHYTGIKLVSQSQDSRKFDLLSLDKKNPIDGYTIENVVFCCWGVNQMKRDLPYDEFIKICKAIAAIRP